MATVNLGRIKPVFRGAYNNSTAYVIDDIVTSGNETFIAIAATQGNATSDASKWTKLAAKGADGTDVGTTLTTQGDILFRDGSGLQRLAIGTAGQILKVNSGATALEYGADEGGKILQVVENQSSTNYTQSGSGNTDCTNYNTTITPSATSSKIFICMSFRHFVSDGNCHGNHEANGVAYIRDVTNGSDIEKLSNINMYTSGETRAQNQYIIASRQMIHSPSTTSAITYSVRLSTSSCYTSESYGDFRAVLMEIAG